MNSASLVPIESPPLPPRLVTDWRRFSSGLWRMPEGDIQAGFCADTFLKVKLSGNVIGRAGGTPGADTSRTSRRSIQTYRERLNHWARKVSTPPRARHNRRMGSQNSRPVRPFSTKPFRDNPGVQATTLATDRIVIKCARKWATQAEPKHAPGLPR